MPALEENPSDVQVKVRHATTEEEVIVVVKASATFKDVKDTECIEFRGPSPTQTKYATRRCSPGQDPKNLILQKM
eukprot:2082480-Amphidinium_carterae.1